MFTHYTIILLYFFLFFFHSPVAHRDLHSFPTRALPISVPNGFISPIRRRRRSLIVAARWRLRVTDWHADSVRAADRKSTRLNSSHVKTSYAVFCLKKKRLVIFVLYVFHNRENAPKYPTV